MSVDETLVTFADVIGASRARIVARDKLAASDPRPLMFAVRYSHGTSTVHVVPSPDEPGRWRVTSFDGVEPPDHFDVESFGDAVRAAHQIGADMFSAKEVSNASESVRALHDKARTDLKGG